MKTIEEIIIKESEHFSAPITTEGLVLLLTNVATEYAKQAIIEDRKNLCNYVETNYDCQVDGCRGESINKRSIMNAPNIKLL